MTPQQALPVSAERPRADPAVRGAASVAEGPFVVNLRSSTTPMALSQPSDPALARFKFFVSRRLEDGRERFRLHMGYFETLAEAEEWLAVVREIYPGAWAGEAPGKRLKARAAEPDTAGVATPAAAVEPRPAPVIPLNVPVLRAAPAAAASAPQAAAKAPAAIPLPASSPSPSAARAASSPPKAAAGARPSAGKPAAAPPKPKAPAAPLPLSNVREVLAALDESGATRQMPTLAEPRRARTASSAAAPASPPRPPADAQPDPERSLTDTQVLKLLEGRRADGSRAEVDSGISMLKPDDTGTRRALKEAVTTNAPVSFAVQLQWSVQPIDISKVPPLAIFSAYTLYTVEGSREGRRWYGLRLGFFSDAISAKQVAHYVRSEFTSVAVVPVSPQERGRVSDGARNATGDRRKTAPSPAPAKSPLRDRLPEPTSEFKLIEDEPAPRSAPAAAPAEPRPAAKSASPGSPAPSKRAPKASAGRVRAREKRSPQTLEETLEILGADELEIDRGRGETLNDTGVRHLRVQVRKNSPFTRLLDRLAERARGK